MSANELIGTQEIAAMLRRRDRRAGGVTAPAQGLVLWKVSYRRKPGSA